MKKIVLYNPSISSTNIGDEIIFESAYKALRKKLDGAYVANISTHLPVSQTFAKIYKNADFKYVCGTNLLRNNLFGRFRQWDINIFNAKKLGPCVLLGVGWHNDGKWLNPYTKHLYKTILDKNALHSVRDEYTKTRLEKLGFKNVINTGCPTMWDLTPEFCSKIPTKKAPKVVFTLTDYKKNAEQDRKIIDILSREYEEVSLWLQGYNDFEYAKSIGVLDKVNIIDPSLAAYDKFLTENDVDYIGTRLHGGVRALQH